MVHLKTILDTRKIKGDGTFSLYYRITDNKKVSYLHTGFSIALEQWDENKQQVKKSQKNAQLINASISKRFFELQKAIIELDNEGIFSLERLKDSLSSQYKNLTLREFADDLIKGMFAKNKTGNAIVYQTAINSLFKFKPSKELRFTDLTIDLLQNYQDWLEENNCRINTISNYLRTIRAIYNKAVKARIVDRKHYPFTELNIKTERTAKRAFSKTTIDNIIKLDLLENTPICKARDFYILSFYLIGINFTDIAYLTKGNIVGDRIEYKRRKTGHCYSIKILPQALNLIDKYLSYDGQYLFRLLPDEIVPNCLQAKRLIQQWIKTTNKYLKVLSTGLNLDKPCTTYTVRHSWATIAKQMGYSKEVISEALGHQQGNQITEIYLDKYDSDVIDNLNETVCR